MRTIKNILEVLLWPFIIVSWPLLFFVTKTGLGIRLYRWLGLHPLLVHFYQPIPNYETVPLEYFRQKQKFPGFTISPELITRTLRSLSQFSHECSWPEHKQDRVPYYAQNPFFGYSSACLLHSIIRSAKTKKIVEVGSGFSTLISQEALSKNWPAGDWHLTCIEPYPKAMVRDLVRQHPSHITLLTQKAQEADLNIYTSLEANDILFIDSSHVSGLNSDVNFLFLQILPRLKHGVLVHIHDIYIPYEYPKEHFWGNHKLFWNEQYMLQAFLTNNKEVSIILPAFYTQKDMTAEFQNTFNNFDPQIHRPSSSFWMKIGN